MHRSHLIAALVLGLTAHAGAAEPPAYTVARSVALGAPDKWDYVSFDAASQRVFVAHGDHTDVVDATSGQVLNRLGGLHGAHGQTVGAGGTIYADSGQTGELTAFDPKTFAPGKTIPAGKDADGVVYDPASKLVAVLDGDAQGVTLIDSATNTVRATVELGGEPEFAAADGHGLLYVNLASTREIARVDIASAKVTARYPVPDCLSPHGMAMDPATRRLFVTCENRRIIVVDADGGHVLQTLPIGEGTDAAAFDPVHRTVFSSNGDGTLSVFTERQDGSLTALGDVKTPPGARTLAVNPATGRVFLVTADIDPAKPVTQGSHGPRFAWKPGSVHLLFLDPAPK